MATSTSYVLLAVALQLSNSMKKLPRQSSQYCPFCCHFSSSICSSIPFSSRRPFSLSYLYPYIVRFVTKSLQYVDLALQVLILRFYLLFDIRAVTYFHVVDNVIKMLQRHGRFCLKSEYKGQMQLSRSVLAQSDSESRLLKRKNSFSSHAYPFSAPGT